MQLFRMTLIAAALAGCGNTYHPEYHPQSSFSYQETTSTPVVVHPQPGQGVQVMPAPARTVVLPAPPPPPKPPADFPW
jgi:hypothetical protein